MLEVTILKTKHEGIAEARKLLPFIQQSDVFSTEEVYLDHSLARNISQTWNRYLKSSMSRTELRRLLEDAFGSNAERNYFHTIYDYMYRNNVAFYPAEQYTPEQAQQMRLTAMQIDRDLAIARALITKQVDGAEEAYYNTLVRYAQFNEKRERAIADTVASAEKIINDIYPRLENKPELRYSIQIGAAHALEEKIPCARVVDLSDIATNKDLRISDISLLEAIKHGATCDELRTHIRIAAQALCTAR